MSIYAIIESMTTLTVGRSNWLVRIWRNETDLRDVYDNQDLQTLTIELSTCESPSQVARMFADMPRVNAVEVKNVNGFGVVVYPEWP